MGTFNTIPHFKFWCQKVLPLVYDDSLSYYELLCKIVNYLNHIIDDVNQIPEIISELIDEGRIGEILSLLLDELREQIAETNEHNSDTATEDISEGTLIWSNDKLYVATRDILSGDRFVEPSEGSTGNVEKITLEKFINDIKDEINNSIGNLSNLETTHKDNLVEAINEENENITLLSNSIGDLSNLETTHKDNLVEAINEEIEERTEQVISLNTKIENNKVMVSVKLYGAKGDGVTDDTNAFNEWLTDIQDNGWIGYIPNGTYSISEPLSITKTCNIVGESDNAILLFEGSNGIHITNSMNTWGCYLSSFSIQTKDTQYTGLIVEGNYHKIYDITFTGYGVKSGNSSYYWSTCLQLKGAWYTYIKGIRTMGGALHSTTQSNIHGWGIHAMGTSVNVNIESSTILYHDRGIYIEAGCEAVRMINNIMLGNYKGVMDGGYYDSVVNNIIDMCIDYGVDSSGNGVTIIDNFIAQHYYEPYSDNENYHAILTTGVGAVIKNNYLPTTSQPNNGIICSGDETTIDSNYISWFKTSIYFTGDKTICTNNHCVHASLIDIVFNASYCVVTNNTLSNNLISKQGGTNNVTQHDELIYTSTVSLDSTLYSQNIELTVADGYFSGAPSIVIPALTWSGFDIYYDKSNSTATSVKLVATNRGQTLPDISTQIICLMKQ